MGDWWYGIGVLYMDDDRGVVTFVVFIPTCFALKTFQIGGQAGSIRTGPPASSSREAGRQAVARCKETNSTFFLANCKINIHAKNTFNG
jgi:hypothetical protein